MLLLNFLLFTLLNDCLFILFQLAISQSTAILMVEYVPFKEYFSLSIVLLSVDQLSEVPNLEGHLLPSLEIVNVF